MQIKIGTVIYSKKFFRKNQNFAFESTLKKGFEAVSIFLGTVKTKDVNFEDLEKDVIAQMHGLGWTTFDDIEKVLGGEACDKMINYHENFYKELDEKKLKTNKGEK